MSKMNKLRHRGTLLDTVGLFRSVHTINVVLYVLDELFIGLWLSLSEFYKGAVHVWHRPEPHTCTHGNKQNSKMNSLSTSNVDNLKSNTNYILMNV